MLQKIVLVSALTIASLNSYASVIVKEGYRITDPTKQFLPQLKLRKDFSFDQINSRGYTIYGPDGLGKWLNQNNIKGVDVNYYEEDKAAPAASYVSNEELGKILASYQTRFPQLAKLESLGKTGQNRDIWALKISKNVTVDEVEPEFKYIANMHGDEITGREVTARLIPDLLENYGKDEQITKLLDNTEIYIIPSMNPDGMAAHRRGNAKSIDLNRDFPDFNEDPINTPTGRAIETQAVMRFQAQHHFALSANYHGGEIVVNYPWDGVRELHPLNDFIVDISKEYASTNPSMKNSTDFTDGITNGYEWYELHGGMQDWSYRWHNDLQVTLEISMMKWVSYSDIDRFYNDNRESMINYLARVHQGAGFKLQDKSASGKVKVIDSHGTNLGEFSFTGGEFFKVLDVGNYTYEIITGARAPLKISVTVNKNEILPHGNYVSI